MVFFVYFNGFVFLFVQLSGMTDCFLFLCVLFHEVIHASCNLLEHYSISLRSKEILEMLIVGYVQNHSSGKRFVAPFWLRLTIVITSNFQPDEGE